MQEKKLTRSKKVIEALRKHYGMKVGEFASMLGVGASTVSTWSLRDSLDEDLLFRKCNGVSFDFLQTGEGEMFAEAKPVIADPEISYDDPRRAVAYDIIKTTKREELNELLFKLLTWTRTNAGDSKPTE